MEIDGRLHAWEWLLTPDGRLLKTDALDHHAAHDLVGAQPAAWDIAGAWAELDLSDQELAHLCTVVERTSGAVVERDLLPFMKLCYLAFQLGRSAMAAASAGEAPEAVRLTRAAGNYAARVVSCAGERPREPRMRSMLAASRS
jgi:hypothetical protein